MNMRTFTFKGLFLTVLFMLLGSLAIQAADDGLLHQQSPHQGISSICFRASCAWIL
jgi:hypothetical protein